MQQDLYKEDRILYSGIRKKWYSFKGSSEYITECTMSAVIIITIIANIGIVTTLFFSPISFIVSSMSIFHPKGRTIWLAATTMTITQIALLVVSQLLLWFNTEAFSAQYGATNTFALQNFFPALVIFAFVLGVTSFIVARKKMTMIVKLFSIVLQGIAVYIAMVSIFLVLDRIYP